MNRQLFYYLHSIVARRILGLFVLCAMLPTATLGIFTLSQVADKLREQAHERLHQASKNVAMTIVEGLTFLKSEMEELAASRGKNAGLSHLVVSKQGGNPLHQRFLSLAILQPNAETKVIFGKSCPLPPLNEPILKQLSSGKAFIYAGRTDSPTLFSSPLPSAEGLLPGSWLAK